MKKKMLFSALIEFAMLLSACAPVASPTATPVLPVGLPAATDTIPPTPMGTTQPTATGMTQPAATGTTQPAATDTIPPVSTATALPVKVPSSPAVLIVGQNAVVGAYLTGTNGMTVYLFTNDTPGTSTCSGNCASTWPPVLTTGAPIAGMGVDAALLGTFTRPDGTTQVTYNSLPLYYYSKDAAAGDINGEEINNTWFVIAPDGTQR